MNKAQIELRLERTRNLLKICKESHEHLEEEPGCEISFDIGYWSGQINLLEKLLKTKKQKEVTK
jgi:3'-phosphoadenosine 5'-phosphosulfate sulfotransferase